MTGLFFDTETTGFQGSGLVQLGAILQDLTSGRILSELNVIAYQPDNNPPIPEAVIRIHGIDDVLCMRYGLPLAVIDKLFSFLIERADILVAHNIEFDLSIVQANLPLSWNALLLPEPKQQFCTMISNTDIVKAPHKKWPGKYKWPNMQETHMYYFGKGFEGAHDAMVDIRACRDVYMEMQRRGNV